MTHNLSDFLYMVSFYALMKIQVAAIRNRLDLVFIQLDS